MRRPRQKLIAGAAAWILAAGWPAVPGVDRIAWARDSGVRSESGARDASPPVQRSYFNRLLDRSREASPDEASSGTAPETGTETEPPAPEPGTAAAPPKPARPPAAPAEPLDPPAAESLEAPSGVKPAPPAPALEELDEPPRASLKPPPAEPAEAPRTPTPSDRESEPEETAPSSSYLADEEISAGARRVVEALGARLQGRPTENFDPDLTFGPEAEARLNVPFGGTRSSLLDSFVKTDRREGPTPGSRTVSGMLAFAEASGRRILVSFQADFIQDGDEIWIRRLSVDDAE